MDKNSIIGLILMGVVIVVFTWLGRPSKEEMALRQHYNDSIAAVTAAEAEKIRLAGESATAEPRTPTPADSTLTPAERDSLLKAENHKNFGEMASAAVGEEETVTLETDSVAFVFSSKGARLAGTTLKTHNDYLGRPIRLVRDEDATMGFTFITKSNRVIHTADLYFKVEKPAPGQVRFTAPSSDGSSALSVLYTLRDTYRVDMEVTGTGDFASLLASNAAYLDAEVRIPVYQNEKSESSEQRYSGMAYQYADGGDVEKMNASKSESVETSSRVQWIGFRDMFFSTIFYAEKGLEGVSLNQTLLKEKGTGRLKELEAKFILPIEAAQPIRMTIYSGPNDYALLHKIDKELDNGTSLGHVVDMGSWFRFITVWLIVPLFNFLERYLTNYGLIIFIMTLLIKIVLSPFTWKTFKSQAKMRVLKPKIDEINAKYPGEDQMMERQKKTMELYSSAGVNTMGGCLPMLLQMPFLIAMYQYFPTSINLRGESFLWAKDLSTYDDVINWGFNIPFIGDHLALFCLLMTVTQVVYMQITSAMGNTDPSQKKLMLIMTIFMSVMLFTFLNNNAAALSYYYLLSMLISILQTQAFKWAIDEKKVLAELEENRKKPKKKSKWMQKLEEAQKLQEQRLKEQKKR